MPETPKTVTVSAGDDAHDDPGASVTLKAAVDAADGSTVSGYTWVQTSGVPAALSGADSDTLSVTLADSAAYVDALVGWLEIRDSFGVQGINPHALEAAEIATFKVTVTTSSGSYSDSVSVVAGLPYVFSPGISNVPVGVPVLLRGKAQDAYSWSISGPGDAELLDASSRFPSFTPGDSGTYALAEANSGAEFEVYAGTWTGVITGIDEDGLPESDAACVACHNGTVAGANFDEWKGSGHAHILTQNIDNPNGHWALRCASCHVVGYAPGVDNGGFDEAIAAEGWEAPHGHEGNWAHMVEDYPQSARLANIQCENCHGPQDSEAHMNPAARQNLSSDLCGLCHGEPPRHGRYQQWEESGHANLELVLEEGTVEARGGTAAHCGRCHSGQGFLAWIEQDNLSLRIQGADGNATEEEMIALGMTADAAEGVTCVVCHDPHDVGKSSGEPNTATVRISGNTATLPAGFRAVGVGRGALCMTCHNTRNGLRNSKVTETVDDRAPHTAAQTDVLMGQNAFFVETGSRGAHSLITDTCTHCHMEVTPPPAELSYNLAGSNHAFEASMDVCTECHGAYDGGVLQVAVEEEMHRLAGAIEAAIAAEILAQTEAGNTVTLVGMGADEADVVITDGSTVGEISLIETHGRVGMDLHVGETAVEHVRLGSDTLVKDASGAELGNLVTASDAGQLIGKAGWNYYLLHGDGSEGVHNPSFTLDVIKASIEALE